MVHDKSLISLSNRKKVCVLVTTYNHEKFIAEAINGILIQEVKFDYEVVIIEDCSTDNTRDIVIDLQRQHPDKVRLVLEDRNQNNNRTWIREIQNSQAQYVACLDGDDYWTSPHKLQRQVDFLESHPECSICFHNTTIVYDDNSKEPFNSNPPEQKRISTLEDLWVAGCFIQTCSVMFRAGLFEVFPSWFETIWAADWALHILNAQYGKIGYIDEVMGAYRQHSGGVWNGLSRIQQILKVMEFYRQMNVNVNFGHDEAIRHVRELWGGELVTEIPLAFRAGGWREGLRGAMGLLRYYPEHILTEFWPCYRPVHFRRYPIIHRLPNRLSRHVKELWANGEYGSRYEGFVDKANSYTVEGWAWDANQPNSPIEIEIFEDDSLWATLPADRFRRDLIEAGKGNGYHAFKYLIPDQLRDGKSHRIYVKVSGSRFPLNPSPTEIKC